MNLYSIRSTSHGYLIAKFDSDFNVVATYQFHNGFCECPAFQRRDKCKHQAMVNLFKSKDRLDTDWFYNNEAKAWSQPIASTGSEPVESEPEVVETNSFPASGSTSNPHPHLPTIKRRI